MERTPNVYLFEFYGSAVIADEQQHSDTIHYEFIPTLNQKSSEIAERIKKEVKRSLPFGINVEAQIEFYPGSIEFAGVIYILDIMSKLAGAARLLGYIGKAIKFALNRVVRNEIRSYPPAYQIESITSEVTLVESQPTPSVSEGKLSQHALNYLTVFNSLVSLVILILILMKFYF